MVNHVRAIGVAMALLLIACTGESGTKKPAAGTPGHARVGEPAPGWSEPTTQGSSLSLATLHGKLVYLNFFATWCPPCNEEAPAIDALAREYRARGVQVVGVDVLENARKAAEFARTHRLSYPVIVDDGTLRDQYAINGLPVHAFIDRDGVVRSIVVGEISTLDMRGNVDRLLK